MRLTHQGQTLKVPEWSAKTGLSPATIIGRIARGWSAERALTEPAAINMTKNGVKVTKNDAEMWLNTLAHHDLPKTLASLVDPEQRSTRFGTLLRSRHRETFDTWFSKEFILNPQFVSA